jgi:hypothetical protein
MIVNPKTFYFLNLFIAFVLTVVSRLLVTT